MPTRPETEYSKHRNTDPALEAVRRRDLERDEERERERERMRDSADRPTVREPQPKSGWSLAFGRGGLRGRISMTVLASLVGGLTMLCTHLWTYLQGIGDDRVERDAALSEVRAVREQLDQHEARIAAMVVAYKTDLTMHDDAVKAMAHVQLLQWAYVSTVIEAARARKPIPPKPADLAAAEAKAAIAIRDKP